MVALCPDSRFGDCVNAWNGFLTGFRMEPKWQIDPQLLFVGPKIGEGAHAKVYEGK